MSQHVTCPKCKHQFEIDDLSDRYEKYVAKLIGGALAPKNNPAIDVIGKDGTTYQVKFSKYKKYNWKWHFSFNHVEPDFCVLFGILKDNRFIFLLPYATIKSIAVKRKGNHNSASELMLVAVSGLNGYIWNYYVSPENFMARVAELKASQQLALEFTQGFGD